MSSLAKALPSSVTHVSIFFSFSLQPSHISPYSSHCLYNHHPHTPCFVHVISKCCSYISHISPYFFHSPCNHHTCLHIVPILPMIKNNHHACMYLYSFHSPCNYRTCLHIHLILPATITHLDTFFSLSLYPSPAHAIRDLS